MSCNNSVLFGLKNLMEDVVRTDNDNNKANESFAPQSRRKAVKTIVGGIGTLAAYNMLPVRWETPIIEQIFLPAHAQTSACLGCSLEDPCKITLIAGDQSTAEVVVRVDGFVTPATAGLPVTIEVTPFTNNGDPLSSPSVNQTITDEQGMFTGTYTIAGGPGIDAVSAITTVAGADGAAGCDVSTQVGSPEKPPEDPCITVTFSHAPPSFRPAGVILEGNDCDGNGFSEAIRLPGIPSTTLSFNRINPEVLSRVGRFDVIAEIQYLDGTTDTVPCNLETTIPLSKPGTVAVTVTFTPVAP